jgi:hypothetical protein
MSRADRKNQQIDRRRFLVGAGGSVLALPMLESFLGRKAYAQPAAPKRLVVIMNPHGRLVGNGRIKDGVAQDTWSPLTKTGPYPATGDLSPQLAALGEVRNDIVTIDGVDNLVRHMVDDPDGHTPCNLTVLTCVRPKPDRKGGGPSIDYVAGERLRASAAQQSALVFPASVMDAAWKYDGKQFYRQDGTPPTLVESNPVKAIHDLFASITGTMTAQPAPAAKTLHDRMVARRGSILDSVAQSYTALGQKVSAADRDRLDRHATFIRTLETRLGGSTPGILAKGCAKPDETLVPKYDATKNNRGDIDGLVTPWIIENLVMSLACDITRVASLHFFRGYDYAFASEFAPAPSPLGGGANFHSVVHDTPALASPNKANLIKAYGFYARMVARLIKRLGEITDVDGSRLLDNTLVVWVGDMGYGAAHHNFNIPVLMAGMKRAFPGGQGRHLVLPERRSLGDLYSQVLRMLGGSDKTFGQTGTLADSGLTGTKLNPWSGYEGYITPSLPLHHGALAL